MRSFDQWHVLRSVFLLVETLMSLKKSRNFKPFSRPSKVSTFDCGRGNGPFRTAARRQTLVADNRHGPAVSRKRPGRVAFLPPRDRLGELPPAFRERARSSGFCELRFRRNSTKSTAPPARPSRLKPTKV